MVGLHARQNEGSVFLGRLGKQARNQHPDPGRYVRVQVQSPKNAHATIEIGDGLPREPFVQRVAAVVWINVAFSSTKLAYRLEVDSAARAKQSQVPAEGSLAAQHSFRVGGWKQPPQRGKE